jgi:hypothetical protein
MRVRWTFLIQVVTALSAPVLGRLVWSSSHSMWSGYGAVFAVPVVAVAVAAAAPKVRRVHQSDQTIRGILLRRRQLARARVESPDQLHAQAPVAAALFALVSFPAAILALVAAPSAGGLDLPPTADARLQLWCIAAVVLIAVVGVDGWFGLGISVRALATDGFTASAVGFTIALAATSPLMIFHHVDSRAAWLGVAAAQFVWSFGGLFLCGAVSERRKRRLYRLVETSLDPSAGWLGEPGIDAHYDLILQSPGNRKIHVIQAVVTVTGMLPKEAKDLVDDAPGLVLRQVTSDRADRAKDLLESRGATVTVSSDRGWD